MSDENQKAEPDDGNGVPDAADVVATGSVPLGGGTQPSTTALIFISYRIASDEKIAIALKRLLESSIDPKPDVFVSGAGGLRPSKIGYKPQLQRAVQRASAFVGLITQASKEREWIFYEAGAAWGRGQIYAPVLVDTTPGDLPSSIADYQATRAHKSEEIQQLVESLAEAIGGEARTHFAQRYRAFEKVLRAYAKRDETADPDDTTPLGQAWALLRDGKTDEANALFEKLEKEAPSPDARAEVRFSRILAGKETGVDLLEKFEAVEEELKGTAEYRFWRGAFEPKPLTAIVSLEESLRDAKPGTFIHRMATITLAKRNMDIGRDSAAREVLTSAVRASDRVLREDAVARWLELFPSLDAVAKLFLLMIGLTARKSEKLLDAVVDLAMDQGWPALLVRFAATYDDEVDTPYSAHQLGRALATVDLPSLAFRAYSRAAKGGVTVAKSNLAALLRSGPVAAAGHEILEAHAGTIDASSKAYPHRVRAEIEEAIERESKLASERRALGFKITQQFTMLADLALAETSEHPLREDVAATIIDRFQSTPAASRLAAAIESKEKLELSRTLPGFNVWTVANASGALGFVHVKADGAFVGFRAPLTSGDTSVFAIGGAPEPSGGGSAT